MRLMGKWRIYNVMGMSQWVLRGVWDVYGFIGVLYRWGNGVLVL